MNSTIKMHQWAWLLIVLSLGWFHHAAWGQDKTSLDEAGRSASYLLRGCMRIDRSGNYHNSIEALRQMRDPALEPFFQQLIQSGHPSLIVHGVLGLAEASRNQKLDLTQVAAIQEAPIQAQIISAAIDSELLTTQQAQQLIGWPGIDPAIKIVVAAQLVKDHPLPDLHLEDEANSDNLARRGLASLLRLQRGDHQALEILRQLDRSDDRQRDQVRKMLLETAMRYELDSATSWAAGIAAAPDVNRWLGLLALRVAMRFGSPGAIDSWRGRFTSSTDAAQRMRLALLALGLAPWLDQGLFEPLISDHDVTIQHMGQAGMAIASNDQIDTAVINLIEMHHPMANRWALTYAKEHAEGNDAQVILLGLIMAFDDYPSNRRSQAFKDVIRATRTLIDRYPHMAKSLLRPLLIDLNTDPLLVEGILLGLLSCSSNDADEVIAGLPGYENQQINPLMVLLLAKHGRSLSLSQNETLKVLVRGGGNIRDTLRLQAAWVYLKQTHQSQIALKTMNP